MNDIKEIKETQVKILRVAKFTFTDRGLANTTMERIAADSRMSMKELESYYRNTEDLWNAITHPVFDETKDANWDEIDNVDDSMNAVKDIVKKFREELLMMMSTDTEEKSDGIKKSYYDKIIESLTDIIIHMANIMAEDGEILPPVFGISVKEMVLRFMIAIKAKSNSALYPSHYESSCMRELGI